MQKDLITFDELMNVVNGEVKMVGQNGEQTVGAAQNYYFGTRIGKDLDVEDLVTRFREQLDTVTRYAKNLQTILEGKQKEYDQAIADRIDKKMAQYKNYSVDSLKATIAKLTTMMEAKVA